MDSDRPVSPPSKFPPRHTPDCATCARPTTEPGRRLLSQLHGWPERKEYPWNLVDADDILAIEVAARAAPQADEGLRKAAQGALTAHEIDHRELDAYRDKDSLETVDCRACQRLHEALTAAPQADAGPTAEQALSLLLPTIEYSGIPHVGHNQLCHDADAAMVKTMLNSLTAAPVPAGLDAIEAYVADLTDYPNAAPDETFADGWRTVKDRVLAEVKDIRRALSQLPEDAPKEPRDSDSGAPCGY